jgi:hypothetical protein
MNGMTLVNFLFHFSRYKFRGIISCSRSCRAISHKMIPPLPQGGKYGEKYVRKLPKWDQNSPWLPHVSNSFKWWVLICYVGEGLAIMLGHCAIGTEDKCLIHSTLSSQDVTPCTFHLSLECHETLRWVRPTN